MTSQDQSGSTELIVNTISIKRQETAMTISIQKMMMSSAQQDPAGAGHSWTTL